MSSQADDVGDDGADIRAPVRASVRVLISYAHDDPHHQERVRQFWTFLRSHGVDARLDVLAANSQQDWPDWMGAELRAARFVLVVASPAYKERAEGRAQPGTGRGVKWEARLLRDVLYRDGEPDLTEVVSVVLPGGTADDLPDWLTPASRTWYGVSDYTVSGAEKLLRLLTDQPAEREPVLGLVPELLPRPIADYTASAGGTRAPLRAAAPLRTEVLITARFDNGELVSEVSVAGSPISSTRSRLSTDIGDAWVGLKAGPMVAGQRMLRAGRALAVTLFDEASQHHVADLVDRLRPGSGVDIVLAADDDAIGLPIELLRLRTAEGADLGLLALAPGVTVRRVIPAVSVPPSPPLAGPLKILAAVAAPDETKTDNAPLDVEREMEAMLDAVAPATTRDTDAQVRILEVASLQQIQAALREDEYHVLHLSAHGSPTSIELENEDGEPVLVGIAELLGSMRNAGRGVPLIVLSSCSGGALGAEAMAAGLVRRGADRVIAMQTSVTADYATKLTAALYAELADEPAQPVARALARARRDAEDRGTEGRLPEYGVATLLSVGEDIGLVDPSKKDPLGRATQRPAGTSVRELGIGQLIGRRTQLREATAVLRRTPDAKREHGAIAGVQLLGIGGIGKTALAGRLTSRLRQEGWLIAVHEGQWNPTALFAAVAASIADHAELAEAATALTGEEVADEGKLDLVEQLLSQLPLLLVLDDFEQNLTPGGSAFKDPTFEAVLTDLTDAALAGAFLVTCRYPIPGEDRALISVPVPPLSPAELRRFFLRLPGLDDLSPEDRRLLTGVVGGHPRLIEFVGALLRGRRAQLPDVQAKLRALAKDHGVSLTGPRAIQTAVDHALVLGAADIFLDELVTLLTPGQRAALDQLAVCRAPMSAEDLAVALTNEDPPVQDDVNNARAHGETLTDLTLLTPGAELLAHPWTAQLITDRHIDDVAPLHERALAVRLRRFRESRAGYADLVDLPRHLAALGRFDEVLTVAEQGVALLPGALAAAAYLAELRPLIPTADRVWILLADLEFRSIVTSGDLSSAARLFQGIHSQVETRAAADPTNTGWQRDLTVSYERLGDVAVAAGDTNTAAAHYRAGLTIAERLAATDPTNTEWQRGAQLFRERLTMLDAEA